MNNPEDYVCGVKPFALPKEHPFTRICYVHDLIFDRKEAGENYTRGEADKLLLRGMLAIAKAKKSYRLRAEAYVYYGLARAFGGLFWD